MALATLHPGVCNRPKVPGALLENKDALVAEALNKTRAAASLMLMMNGVVSSASQHKWATQATKR